MKVLSQFGLYTSGLIFIHILGQRSGQQGDHEDYCALFGDDDIQGLKHGFLTGKMVYFRMLFTGSAIKVQSMELVTPISS